MVEKIRDERSHSHFPILNSERSHFRAKYEYGLHGAYGASRAETKIKTREPASLTKLVTRLTTTEEM